MADDVTYQTTTPATPPNATVVRAVQKNGKDAQVVVLDLGGAGAESLLTTTLPVSLASLPAATANGGSTVTTSTAMTGTGTVAALSGLVNQGTATFFTSGTWTGTITFQASFDGGTTFTTLVATTAIGGATATAGTFTANSANGWVAAIPGATNVRLQCTILGTGTAVGTITTTPMGGAVQLIGGSVALSAGANTVGSVAIGAGSSVAATGIAKAEDAAHTTGDTGVMVLGVRNDGAATDMNNANADYGSLSTDIKGRLITVPANTRIVGTSAALTTSVTTYTSGDQMGTEITFANAVRISGGNALIVGAVCTSDAAATPGFAFDLNLYNAATTPASDNAAAAWSDADTQKLAAVISFPAMTFATNNGWCQASITSPIAINAAATSIFGDLIARGAIAVFTAATDLKIQLTIVYL